MMLTLPLGPFDLHEPIGRGGMGEVWRGTHRATTTPVALKLLTGRGSVRPYFLSAFRNEVRAMAGLDHPYIAMVLDHGEVSAAEAAQSQGLLQEGYPYIAMELAEGGSLAPWCGRLSWGDVREVVVSLLDALAHAHARGVIHRDLKPGNVLLGNPTGPRPGVKLSDFGLAHLQRDAFDGDPLAGGTPFYMAPEQSARSRVEQGPATDLYGVGRLTAALLWGAPLPGPGQISAGPSVPPALHAWLARMLHREPAERFPCAADALAALEVLGDLPDADHRPSQLGALGVSGDTFVLSRPASLSDGEDPQGSELDLDQPPTALEQDSTPMELLGEQRSESALDEEPPVRPPMGGRGQNASQDFWSELTPTPLPPPRFSADWRRPDTPAPPPRLMDAGLTLCGLRPPPLVDRVSERDALWQALREATERRRPVVVELHGPAGCGTSRLAEWLCERAHELGAAWSVRVTHGPQGAPSDGLGPALGRALRCGGLSRDEVLARVERRFARVAARDPEEAVALTELIQPATRREIASGARTVRFSGPAERHAVVRRLLQSLSSQRPQILWIDDAPWGPDALAFVEHLLGEDGETCGPVLVVLTVTDEEVGQRPLEAEALHRVRSSPHARSVEVRPLEGEHRGALLRGLLGLEAALAAVVEERTAGNPMFAVQLVSDWVFRGVLEATEQGFRLRRGAAAELPQHIYGVWAEHLKALLGDRPSAARIGLEIAATLGLDVDGREWALACAEEGLSPPIDLIEAMLERRLARAAGDPQEAWSFSHGMLRESVERLAQDTGRVAAHHRAAAAVLRRDLGLDLSEARGLRLSAADVLRVERLGRHCLRGGDPEEALLALGLSARARLGSGDYAEVDALLVERERAADALNLPPEHERRAEGWLLRGRLVRFRGRSEEAEGWQRRVVALAEARGWTRLHAEALAELGALSWGRGLPTAALALARRSVEVGLEVGDPALTGHLRMLLAAMLRRRGDLANAEIIGTQAARDHRAAGDEVGEAQCLNGLGDVARLQSRMADAREAFEAALACFQRAGARRGIADGLNALGEIARLEGRLDEAERCYRASLARMESIGAQLAVAPACNLGLVMIEAGRYPEAARQLTGVLQAIERHGPRIYLGNIHAYLLPCLGALGEWSRFDRALQSALELLQESGQIELDVARMAGIAAQLAAAQHQMGRARAALQLSLSQWRALGRADRVEELELALQQMAEG